MFWGLDRNGDPNNIFFLYIYFSILVQPHHYFTISVMNQLIKCSRMWLIWAWNKAIQFVYIYAFCIPFFAIFAFYAKYVCHCIILPTKIQCEYYGNSLSNIWVNCTYIYIYDIYFNWGCRRGWATFGTSKIFIVPTV